MALSEVALQKAKPDAKPYRLSDGGGLYAIVRPNGAKWWRFDYRVNDTRKTISLGVYPDVPLADARAHREDARKLVAKGVDPALQRKTDDASRKRDSEDTFGKVALEYIEQLRDLNRTEATVTKNKWLLIDKASALSSRPIKDITPNEILDVLKRLEAKGRRDSARSLRTVISSVYRFAIANLRAEHDPTYPLRGALLPVQSTPQSAVTDERKFGGLLRSIDEFDGWLTLRAALQIMALCYPRPIELRKAEWAHFDLGKAVWTIPAELAKMRRPHDIALSRQALAIFESLKSVSGDSKYVFPSISTSTRIISDNGMNSALRRMGYTQNEHCSHGFRASASSILNRRKFHPDVIERSLAHVEPNKVRRAYNRYAYWDERVEMAQAWADICDDLKQARRRNDDLI